MTGIIGFAHRGAPRTRSEANTLPAFERALRLGAGGLETDIGLTRDGVPVLTHPGIALFGRRRTGDLTRDELPAGVPTLHELYLRCGTDFDLSLDMAQPRSVDAVIATAEEFGAIDRLWLTYWRIPTLAAWRRRWPEVHLVYPTIPLRFKAATRLLDRLSAERVDVLNVHHRFCRPQLVAHAHERNVHMFAWGIRSHRPLQRAIRLQVDGIYCDDVAGMVTALRQIQA